MKTRVVGILALAVAITTLVLAVIMAGGEVTATPATTLEEKIESLGDPGLLFYLAYVNAVLITILGVAMFAGFFAYYRDKAGLWSTIAFAFVPIYGLGNIIAYSSQVFVVPHLLDLYHQPETRMIAQVLLGLAIHNWYGTAIEALNILSYAILGIPSIIFAVIMFKTKGLRVGSILLALSGVLSFVAVVGVATQNLILGMMTLVSAAMYMVSLVIIGVFFVRQPAMEGN